MEAEGIDLVFLPKHSADLDYLTGTERRVVTFGNVAYTHHWVAGAFCIQNTNRTLYSLE